MNSAKENMDLYKKAMEQGYANAMELGELQLRSFKGLAEKQLEMLGILMDVQVKQADLLGSVKDYPEYLGAQSRIGRDLAEAVVAKSRETMDLVGSAGDEYRAWLEKSASAAGEQVRQAAEAQA